MASFSSFEKGQESVPFSIDTGAHRRRRRRAAPLIGLLGVAALYYVCRGVSYVPSVFIDAKAGSPTGGWDWAELKPSKDLEWRKCYDGKFDCARLDVPLDWLDPSDEERVVLAVIRAPAKTQENYGGPVFINPGGPGGSGVSWIENGIADHFQTIVGDNHDIVSWDPRGIGASVPRIDCWGSLQKRHDWGMQNAPVVDSHPGMVYDTVAQMDAVSQQCESFMNTTTPGLLHHISTASHARDLLEISEKAGFPKVKYWGVSYGTVLGGTFAALFPDRVERLVSDGNVDYRDWFTGEQVNFLEDADKIMEAFFEFCHKAGPDKCGFYQSTPAAIQLRFSALLDSLKKSPVLIPAGANGTELDMPELVTYSKLQILVRTCLYKAIHDFPSLAKVMAALEEKNGVPYYEMANKDRPAPLLDFCSVNETLPTVPKVPAHSDDAFPAIMCADGEVSNDTPDSFQAYAEKLKYISRYAGASNTHFKLSCAGRQVRPKWRFAGPFEAINTSFPILFIGNIADNVTPLRSARNNSKAFPGSVVLVQKSYGHCSLAAPSTCSAKVINEYFQKGALPEPDTYCDQDYELFQHPPARVDGEDGGFAFAVLELSRRAGVIRG
ncbi:TAP-like protein-domain-containing protein [Xylariales sp. AK1849]|nr:TAP-like protein-domain-containing protein [Xylariales sp. AK1849]